MKPEIIYKERRIPGCDAVLKEPLKTFKKEKGKLIEVKGIDLDAYTLVDKDKDYLIYEKKK